MSGDCWQADISCETLIIDSSGIPATVMPAEPEPLVAEPEVEEEPELPVVLLAEASDEPLEFDVSLEPEALALESGTVVEAVVSLESLLPLAEVPLFEAVESEVELPVVP